MVDSLHAARVTVVKDSVLTRERILDAVSEQLESSGIAGLRLRDVAERLHVSVPSLYRFFEDREAMIDAAFIRDFSRQTLVDLDELGEVFAAAESVQDYLDGLRRLVVDVFSEHAKRARWRKLAAIAATRHDPSLLEQIEVIQRELTGRIAGLYAMGRDRGWVTSGVNPLAFAYAVQGMALGPLFADVSSSDPGVTSEEFAEVFLRFHRAITD
jgi:AcrR family transcriptional regulator